MAKHFLKFKDITLISPWAECPCWTWEAMIPSLAKVVQLQTCWKQRSGKEEELFRSMSFILKGKTVALRSRAISLKHDFCLCCRSIYCSKTSWHLGGVGRTDLHKKGEKISNLQRRFKRTVSKLTLCLGDFIWSELLLSLLWPDICTCYAACLHGCTQEMI